MAKRSSPGMNPMGHGPFDKEKLEGPKKHHDNHGMHASVPGKGNKQAVPSEHWEIGYNQWAPSANMVLTEGDDFVARPQSSRKTTHLMVNKEDH